MDSRARYNVWGVSMEDFFKCLTMPMFVASQLELQVRTRMSGTGNVTGYE